jgi:hypothetical protein
MKNDKYTGSNYGYLYKNGDTAPNNSSLFDMDQHKNGEDIYIQLEDHENFR